MWNESNPTSLYLGTTWELISSGKYIQAGNTALQSGGSNSLRIEKTNLPNIKLRTDSTTTTTNEHEHFIVKNQAVNSTWDSMDVRNNNYIAAFARDPSRNESYILRATNNIADVGKTSKSGSGTTGSFSLQTEALGNGTPLNVQPSYITLKFWKRLS